MLPAGSGFLLLIFGFSGNSEIQQGCGLQNVVFQPAGVALDNGLADVLGYRQQEQFAGDIDVSGCQEAAGGRGNAAAAAPPRLYRHCILPR